MHAGHFHLIFSRYVGSNFPADFLQKIETFAFYRLLNIFGAVSADNRSPHEWEKIKRKWPAYQLCRNQALKLTNELFYCEVGYEC